MADVDTDPVRRFAAQLRRLLTLVTLGLLAVLIAERLGYAGAYRAGGVDPAQLLPQLLLSLPALLNLAALWTLRAAASSAAEGEPFGRVAVAAFRRVGALLAVSAATALLVVPLLARLVGQEPQRLIDADISTLVLGAIGLAMIFVGKLIARAGSAERELEAFF